MTDTELEDIEERCEYVGCFECDFEGQARKDLSTLVAEIRRLRALLK